MDADRYTQDESTITGPRHIRMIPPSPRTLEKIGVRTRRGRHHALRRCVRHQPAAGAGSRAGDPGGDRAATGLTARFLPPRVASRWHRWTRWRSAACGAGHRRSSAGSWTLPAPQTAIDDAAKRDELGDGKTCACATSSARAPFERFFAGFAGSRVGIALLQDSSLGRGVLAALVPAVESDLEFLERAMVPGGAPVKAFAHCLCAF